MGLIACIVIILLNVHTVKVDITQTKGFALSAKSITANTVRKVAVGTAPMGILLKKENVY